MGHCEGKGERFLEGSKISSVLIGVVTWVHAFIKTHQTLHLKYARCILKRENNKDEGPNQVGPYRLW